MEGVPAGWPIHCVAAVGMDRFDDSQEHPDAEGVEVASKENRRSKEGHKIQGGLHNVGMLGADAANMPPLVVLAVNQPEEPFVVERSVAPVEEGLIEAVEQEEVEKELLGCGEPGD